jgi:hypothetical protein
MAKRDLKWSKLTTISIQHAMSVDAPTFKPNAASASLSPVRLPIQNANENQEILKQNIAHMYKYYNDLIYRQNDGTTKFDKPTLPEITNLKPKTVSRSPAKENLSL